VLQHNFGTNFLHPSAVVVTKFLSEKYAWCKYNACCVCISAVAARFTFIVLSFKAAFSSAQCELLCCPLKWCFAVCGLKCCRVAPLTVHFILRLNRALSVLHLVYSKLLVSKIGISFYVLFGQSLINLKWVLHGAVEITH